MHAQRHERGLFDGAQSNGLPSHLRYHELCFLYGVVVPDDAQRALTSALRVGEDARCVLGKSTSCDLEVHLEIVGEVPGGFLPLESGDSLEEER